MKFLRPLLQETELEEGVPKVLWLAQDVENVLIFPISSSNLSGYVRGGEGVPVEIPFFDEHYINAFARFKATLTRQQQDKLKAAIKIVVLHHPPFLVPQEENDRASTMPDYMARGQQLLSYLEEEGFHIAVYGHRHLSGLRVHFGFESDGKEQASELVGIINGRFSLEDGLREAFHLLTISLGPLDERVVEVTRLTRKGLSAVPERPAEALVVDPAGRSRRLRSGSSTREHLSRQWAVLPTLVKVLRGAEKWASGLKHRKSFKEVDDVVDRWLLDLDSYLRHQRGVTDQFLEELLGTAARSDTQGLYFIDYRGEGAWAQAELVEHLAQLFRVYLLRNGQCLGKKSCAIEERTWRNSPFIESRLESLNSRPIRPKARHANRPLLKLEMARVLTWESGALARSPVGMALRVLHETFSVPLFIASPASLEGPYKQSDFHVVVRRVAGGKPQPGEVFLDGAELRPLKQVLMNPGEGHGGRLAVKVIALDVQGDRRLVTRKVDTIGYLHYMVNLIGEASWGWRDSPDDTVVGSVRAEAPAA